MCTRHDSHRLRLIATMKDSITQEWVSPPPRLGRMAGTRSMTEKTRLTAPEALVRSGKAICALAMPIAANAMAKKTCMPPHMHCECGRKQSFASINSGNRVATVLHCCRLLLETAGETSIIWNHEQWDLNPQPLA